MEKWNNSPFDRFAKMVLPFEGKAMTTEIATSYKWRTHDGRIISPAEMDTPHLFYSVRMIFNHLAPSRDRIPFCKEWVGIENWDVDYLRDSVVNMLAELSTRYIPDEWMREQIFHMASVTRKNKLLYNENTN